MVSYRICFFFFSYAKPHINQHISRKPTHRYQTAERRKKEERKDKERSEENSS